MTDPTPGPTCPDCGTRLPDDSPHELCPSCLLRQALASRTIAGSDPKPASPPLSPEEIADKFPQFEILECLGRGGMGIVYKARQKTLDRLVAIKVLAGERRDDPQFEARFSREARTLAKLSHPNIVTVHDFGESDGMFFLVMEFIDGVNLRDVLRDGRMEPEQALAIVPEICEALQFAHDHGVVHRDIKPENILMDRDGRVKIADFGIATLVGASAERSGTPPYMAPEQEAAGGTIDHRADIYALGVVFYEMLTGERPEQDPSRPSRRVEIDVRLEEIVLRALEKEPARRYQTAGEFRTVVETIATTPIDGAGVSPATPETPTGKGGFSSSLAAVWRRQPMKVLQAVGLGLLAACAGHFLAGGASEGIGNELLHLPSRANNFIFSAVEGLFSVLALVVILISMNRLPKLALALIGLSALLVFCVLLPGLGDLFATETFLMAVIISNFCLLPAMFLALRLKRQSGTGLKTMAAGSGTPPPPEKRESHPTTTKSRGMFARLWWLFLGMLALGPLIGAVTGLRVMMPAVDVICTVTDVINVKGSEREIKATAERITASSTLDDVSRRLQLAREWNCKPEAVAPRLRQLIHVEPVANTTLIRLEVQQRRHSSRADQIADAITAALVDQPEGPAVSLMEREIAYPSKIRSALPVLAGAILGFLLSPLLALAPMLFLHRRFPEPQPRRWAASVAGVLVIALLVTMGIGVKLLSQIRTKTASQIAPGPELTESPDSPEHAARSFMEAIRDGDIDAAMAWVDPGMRTPEMKTDERLPKLLKGLSDELREEAYVGKLDRLTQFTEWYPEPRKDDARFLAVRIAAPSGGPGAAVTKGLYLILSSTPEGWRVALFGDAGQGKSLSEYFDDFLGLEILRHPVEPPHPDVQSATEETRHQEQGANQFISAGPEQVARYFMGAIRDGDMDNAMVWIAPEMKQKEKFPLHLELASKILRDEIYAGQLDRLTQFAEKEFTNVDGTTMLFTARVTPPTGDQAQDKMHGPVLILSSTPDGWRVVHFGEGRAGKSLSEHVREFQLQSSHIRHPAAAGLGKPQAGQRQVDLPDFDRRDVGPTVLDLASGELLQVPKEVESENDFIRHFNKLGKGDLAWDGAIITIRGARLSEWLDDGWTLRNPEREAEGFGAYRITVPTRLRITTAEGGHYIVDVREKIEGIKDGVRIEYRRSDLRETGKNAQEATGPPEDKFPPEGAEIGRFVLGLQVQPPIAMPKDSPLTIDQVKEVLKGVTWGELLSALADDGKGDNIAVGGRPSPGESRSRYEITFRYGNNPFRMDLAVDWRFRDAEPSRLRPVGMPDKVLTESSEFLPQLVIRYAMKSGHDAAAPAVKDAKAQARQFQDIKTLKQYATALMIYRDDTGSFPPDLATLLDGDFPGKKRWEGLQKDGLMHDHQTGNMARPIYHGSKDLRIEDHEGDKFILLAAPSADPQGKRLAGFLDGSVKVIEEADYQKQIAEQAKAAAPQPGEAKRLPPFFGELKLTESQEQAIQRWLAQQGDVTDPAKLADFVKSILRDDQQAAFRRIIEQGQQPAIPDFKQATKEFHFKANRPSLLTRGTARYLVIPVAIQSEDHIIKTVDWSSRQADGSGQQSIDLSLVLEPSAKGNAKTSQRGKPRTTQNVIAGITMNRKYQVRYANPDGTFVDLLTVDTGKLPPIPDGAMVPDEGTALTIVPWRSNRDLALLISLADKEKTLAGLTALVRDIASWGERDPKATRYLEALRASKRQVEAHTGRNPKDILNDVISDSIQRAKNNIQLEKNWNTAERALRATRFSDNDRYKALIEHWGFVVESDKFPLKQNDVEFQWSVVSITKDNLMLERLTVRPSIKKVPTSEEGKDNAK